jgi:hypothetical protein
MAGPDRCSWFAVSFYLVLSRRCVTRGVEGRNLRLTLTLAVGLLPRCLLTAVVYTRPRCDLRRRHTSGGDNSSDGHRCGEQRRNCSPSHVVSLLSGSQQPSFFCQPSGNWAHFGGADSLLPLQFPFTCLHCPGGCAPAADEVAMNPAGNAADKATTTVQIFFFIRLPPSICNPHHYSLSVGATQARKADTCFDRSDDSLSSPKMPPERSRRSGGLDERRLLPWSLCVAPGQRPIPTPVGEELRR